MKLYVTFYIFSFIWLLCPKHIALGKEAISSVRASLDSKITLSNNGLPSEISGQITYQFSDSEKNDELCFYLPYNDSEYGNLNIKLSKVDLGKQPNYLYYFGGMTEISMENRSYDISVVNDAVIKISRSQIHKTLSFSFKSKIPRLEKSSLEEWFYDGFYPQLLENCQTQKRTYDSHLKKPVTFDVNIDYPSSWQITAPSNTNNVSAKVPYQVKSFQGKKFAFALNKSINLKTFKVGKLNVRLFYKSKALEGLSEMLQATIASAQKWLGKYPHDTLTIIETSEQQSDSLPGLIVLNNPRQASFSTFQENYTNWYDWIFATHIYSQWIRSNIYEQEIKDSWLLQGIVEFLVLKTVQEYPEKDDFFKTSKNGFQLLSMSYRYLQDIMASVLTSRRPLDKMTDLEFNTIRPYNDQSPILYIRQALSLRQIAGYIGEENMQKLLQDFYQTFLFKSITPRDFIYFIFEKAETFSIPERRSIANQFKEWWTKEGWPDFELTSFEKKQLHNGKWSVTAIVEQKSILMIPVEVIFRSKTGENLVKAIRSDLSDTPYWIASVVMDDEPTEVVIDPNFHSFDNDRFNNSNRIPSIKFFPGNAKSISEIDYTAIWFPLAYRKVGEPTSIGLTGAIFKHINDGVFYEVSGTVEKNLGAFKIYHRNEIPSLALKLTQSISQDYYGAREGLLSFSRLSLFDKGPNIGSTFKSRYRQTVGQPNSVHSTYSGELSLSPRGRDNWCYYNISGELEHAPKVWSKDFEYKRSIVTSQVECSLTRRSSLSLQVSEGKLRATGFFPELALFRINDAKGANIRIDDDTLEPVEHIRGGNLSLNLPFWVPFIKNSIIQSRKLTTSFFYDYGEVYAPEEAYYKASGASLSLPIGGDIAGTSPITFSKLSFSIIYFNDKNGERSFDKHYLFNISGSL